MKIVLFILIGILFDTSLAYANPEEVNKLTQFLNTEFPKENYKADIGLYIRIRGKMKFLNSASKKVEVYFAGSTHDLDSEFEFEFLKRAFPDAGTKLKCELQIEQQGQDFLLLEVQKSFADFKGHFNRQEQKIVESAQKTLLSNLYSSELGQLEKYFIDRSLAVRNTDLQFNTKALDYIFEKYGPEQVYETVASNIYFFLSTTREPGLNDFSKEKLATIADNILQSTKHAEYFKKHPAAKYPKWKDLSKHTDREFSDEQREKHFSLELQKATSPVCFSAHTHHVLGTFNNFKDRITDIQITSIEPREPLLGILRRDFELCKKIWGQTGYPSSFKCAADTNMGSKERKGNRATSNP